MTDPITALVLFVVAAVLVVVIIGGGVWMAVRAGNGGGPDGSD